MTSPSVVGSQMIIGPVTNPDPMYTLLLNLAAETGQVAWGPDDSDHDGHFDNYDDHPHDPFRH